MKDYKSFKEFFWKSALPRIGLPWGFVTGLLVVLIQEKEIIEYFLSLEILLQILFFTLVGGVMMALGAGKSLWNRSLKSTGKKSVDSSNKN